MALIKAETEVPYCEAIRPRVSPAATVCEPLDEVEGVELLVDEELELEELELAELDEELLEEPELDELPPPGSARLSPG